MTLPVPVQQECRSRTRPQLPPDAAGWQHSSELRPGKGLGQQFQFLSATGTSSSAGKKIFAIGVTAYNEEARNVHLTLRGLNGCFTDEMRRRGFELHVLVVFDGLAHMHPSCKALVSSLFGVSFQELHNAAANHSMACTFFSTMSTSTTCRLRRAEFSNLNLNVIVKRDNRGKANSLEWFLRAFCSELSPIYAMTTDAGTLLQPRALEAVDDTFRSCPRVTALYNRKEIISAAEEGVTDSYSQALLRSAQAYQYHASTLVDECQSDFGFVSTLPGFASVYKYSEIQGGALNQFFATQTSKTYGKACGGVGTLTTALSALIRENVKLTEDVNIGLAANFKNTSGCGLTAVSAGMEGGTRWDPETTVEKLVQQRRRWNNGGYSGKLHYFWSGAWCGSGHSTYYIANYCLLNFELAFGIARQLTMPAFYAISLHIAAQDFFTVVSEIPSRYSPSLATAVVVVYFLCFIAFCWRHAASKSVSPFFFMVALVANLMCEAFQAAIFAARLWRVIILPATILPQGPVTVAVMVTTLLGNGQNFWRSIMCTKPEVGSTDGDFPLLFAPMGPCIVIFWQLLDRLRKRRRSVEPLVILKNYLCYNYVLAPMIGPWFGIFCVIRYDDLRWGNRPGSVSQSAAVAKMKMTWTLLVQFAAFLVILGNLGLVYVALANTDTSKVYDRIGLFQIFIQIFLSWRMLFYFIHLINAAMKACQAVLDRTKLNRSIVWTMLEGRHREQ